MPDTILNQSDFQQFELRKKQHITLALEEKHQTRFLSSFDQVQLIHEAIPDLNFSDISLTTTALGHTLKTPFFISSMTAGHAGSINLNERFARACAQKDWWFAVGSQRRELSDQNAKHEWQAIRRAHPNLVMLGNIGLSQLITNKVSDIQCLVDNLEATALFIHSNPLQEALQPEGTPQFKNAYQVIEHLCKTLNCPVIIKETGCGFSSKTLLRLNNLGVKAVDVSGLGGTHWGRIEGSRSENKSIAANAANTFANWGITTIQSLLNAKTIKPNYEIWASGGVRSGLDAAKLIALGANLIGIAKPLLESALESEQALLTCMETFEHELKIALFCTGHHSPSSLQTGESCQITLKN